jgi:predicted O-methyltransferase YrrM
VLIYMSRRFKTSRFPDLGVGGGVSGLVLANRLTEDPNGTGLEFFSANK